MPVEVAMNTPLADALNTAIQPKLIEAGWASGGGDEQALAEYIVLMLVNGKTPDQITGELCSELLSLPSDDPVAQGFVKWLFDQIDVINGQINGGPWAAGQVTGTEEVAQNEEGDMDMDTTTSDAPALNAPTGPRSMRNGNNIRGGRDKRMLGQMAKAMDRTGDSVLHRVRGQTGGERINTHGRAPPTGPRTGAGRLPRNNNRAANIQHGLASGMGNGGFGQMPGQQIPVGVDVYQLLEQQNQMMYQLSQQIMNQGQGQGHGFGGNQRGRGKSLFDRTQGRQNHQRKPRAEGSNQEESVEGEDADMSGVKREALNADETVCKYNLNCTNRECKFAHQSPAAPLGTSVDVNDPCSFGAACKNRKCVGRHPSPAAKLAHQSEQDCKFFPNCQNPRCPFKHPSMPICRNGGSCTTANCKFTHVTTKCKFNPCLNPKCAFAHEEGQQGGFKDKVWTAEHVSDRKFADGEAPEELVKPEADAMMKQDETHDTEVIV